MGWTPIMFTLPNNRLLYRFSNAMSLNPDGTSNDEYGTTPDIQIGDGEDALDIALAQ